MALLPRLAVAAHVGPVETAAGAGETDSLERAKQLYRQGQAKYETLDFYGAIELWTLAYAEVPQHPEHARTRALFLYNLASARMRAFELDRDVTHLRQAKGLLERYLASITARDAESDEVREVRRQLAQLDARLAEIEVGESAAPAATRSVEPSPAIGSGETAPANVDRRGDGRPLRIAGVAAAGGGVGLLGLMSYGLISGRAAEREGERASPSTPAAQLSHLVEQGRRGNVLAVVGGVAGAAFVTTGAVLVVLGKRRASDPDWLSFGVGLDGLVIRGRF